MSEKPPAKPSATDRPRSGPVMAAGLVGAAAAGLSAAAPPVKPTVQYQVQSGAGALTPPPLQPAAETVKEMIAAAEARSETKIVAALGEIKLAISELKSDLKGDFREHKASSVGKTTFFITSIALFAAIVAIMAYGGQLFGMGLDASSKLREAERPSAPAVAISKPTAPQAQASHATPKP